jgi:hypothetical protein
MALGGRVGKDKKEITEYAVGWWGIHLRDKLMMIPGGWVGKDNKGRRQGGELTNWFDHNQAWTVYCL